MGHNTKRVESHLFAVLAVQELGGACQGAVNASAVNASAVNASAVNASAHSATTFVVDFIPSWKSEIGNRFDGLIKTPDISYDIRRKQIFKYKIFGLITKVQCLAVAGKAFLG